MPNTITTKTDNTIETIDSSLLIDWGGVCKKYEKDEYIFREGQRANFYYQLEEGKVKMSNINEDGKEFIQGFFAPGQSFGEPPIFDGGEYPASAIADQPSVVIRLHVSTFMQLLKENFHIHLSITRLLAHRLKNKAINLKEISCHNPEHRILSILQKYKEERHPLAGNGIKTKIDFTRQEIADMSGLRVETVIRAMRHLHDKKVLTMDHGKVYY